mmetsp:Transcript_11538/g.26714  ORF Transcript_11538/g.26714 Transcript_11538/m.26714 type:complete len:226 (-) Transcript_11538:616-1293(-)
MTGRPCTFPCPSLQWDILWLSYPLPWQTRYLCPHRSERLQNQQGDPLTKNRSEGRGSRRRLEAHKHVPRPLSNCTNCCSHSTGHSHLPIISTLKAVQCPRTEHPCQVPSQLSPGTHRGTRRAGVPLRRCRICLSTHKRVSWIHSHPQTRNHPPIYPPALEDPGPSEPDQFPHCSWQEAHHTQSTLTVCCRMQWSGTSTCKMSSCKQALQRKHHWKRAQNDTRVGY